MGTSDAEKTVATSAEPKPLTLNVMRDQAYETAKAKGWYEKGRESIPTLLCLIHSEVSEALEAWRVDGDKGVQSLQYPWPEDSKKAGKPEGFASELADIIIRIGDLSGAYNIDLESAVLAKMAYNRTRPYRHGGKHV